MEQARLDTEAAALIALALTALIFIGSCRDILRPLMATFCLLIGICYTLGFATLTVGRLNILSITLVPILIGLAIDYGVHLIFRYEEEVRQGHSRRLAIGKALGFTGIGVITNALTIAGAFYFMMLTDFKGMQEMGLIAGTGVIALSRSDVDPVALLLARGKPDQPDEQASAIQSRRAEIADGILAISRGPPAGRAAPTQPTGPNWAALSQTSLVGVGLRSGLHACSWSSNPSRSSSTTTCSTCRAGACPRCECKGNSVRAGSQSLLYCAVIADSLPQAVEWEQRITRLPSVARVISLVKYLTEDQERKLALNP